MRRKKHVKKGIQFTIMVCGASGTGRTTFINTLCGQNVLSRGPKSHLTGDQSLKSSESSSTVNETSFTAIEPPPFDPAKAHLEPGLTIVPISVDIDEDDGTRISLTVIDTPGFGNNIDNEACFAQIVKYLECQYDEILAEESRIRRNPRFKDNRVHVLLYFIEATGHGLRELDIELMKRLSKRVNIIPVIGRADSLTPTELKATKKLVLEDIEFHNIPVYNFPFDVDEDDMETIEENSHLNSLLPFAVVSSTHFVNIQGHLVRAREYPWGIVDIENPEHSDYGSLRSALMGSHLADLKDLTHDFLYETYRTEKLSKNMGGSDSSRQSALLNPEDMANQSYMLKEEQLQREEEKLREIEIRVQRELSERRLELHTREKELREIEARISRERSEHVATDEHEALQRQIEQQNLELKRTQQLQHQLQTAETPAQATQIAINNNLASPISEVGPFNSQGQQQLQHQQLQNQQLQHLQHLQHQQLQNQHQLQQPLSPQHQHQQPLTPNSASFAAAAAAAAAVQQRSGPTGRSSTSSQQAGMESRALGANNNGTSNSNSNAAATGGFSSTAEKSSESDHISNATHAYSQLATNEVTPALDVRKQSTS